MADVPADFPVTPLESTETVRQALVTAPYTAARFSMTRTFPSGTVLRSSGHMDFRQGVGLLWCTDKPVVNAMMISPTALCYYDRHGTLLRELDLKKSPAAQYTTIFLKKDAGTEDIERLLKLFEMTYRQEGPVLVLGMKSRHARAGVDWMLVRMENSSLKAVEYESETGGHTGIIFSDIVKKQHLPEGPFTIK